MDEINEIKSLSHEQTSAYSDFQRWSSILKRDISRWLRSTSRTKTMTAESHDIDLADRILINGVHWYRALDSRGFNKLARKIIKASKNKEIQITVENLRNLREHWENHRSYFYKKEKPAIEESSNTKALIWYLEKISKLPPLFRNISPDAIIFPGYYSGQLPPDAIIAGIFLPRDLLEEINKMEKIILQNTEEHSFLKGKIKYRY